ncbi:MAG: MBL fold metallo-hydrolase [Oscillibacter sp.]|jgi:7,8-dihydropterin-6-yl-methyl-4-(beta-D-ribofuranosyl)aminobenzene 5'-phosphate synthase|nr:MBL fold metallo-hydrolase [Oscillibacter sp.]
MKITTLLENTACGPELRAAHGLSLYVETGEHRILFDMGPNDDFLYNARTLGIDLARVDLAVLSHGHYDHGGGLRAFCAVNDRAPVYLHTDAFMGHYALGEGGERKDVGLDPGLEELGGRFRVCSGTVRLGEGLTLFDSVPDTFGGMGASANMRARLPDGGLGLDDFHHEQDLLVTEGNRAVVLAGCAHRGIVNIRRRAAELLGREPDVVVGGFHLFKLVPGDPAGDGLIARTGQALAAGETVYYTGHCTGGYAYEKLEKILDGRLRPITGGMTFEV